MASYSISTRQKDKGWQVIVSYKDRYGKWRQKSKQGFTTKRQAKDYGDVIVKDIKENLLLTNNEELANMTFIEFTRLYFDDMKDKLRPNSIIAYRNAIKHLHPIHNVKVSDITPYHSFYGTRNALAYTIQALPVDMSQNYLVPRHIPL